MNTTSTRTHHASHSSIWVGGLLLGIGMSGAFAATPAPNSEIQARYERERAVCLQGLSNQDRNTCLKEAGAARDAARRGDLDVENEHYRRNALERCKALPGDEAKDCRLRIQGAGTTSGSARDGGIYRELVTVEPAAPAPVPAPAPAASAR
ncbi:MAG: hypothetical protein ABI702_20635 [Burkholderiales bacterium]